MGNATSEATLVEAKARLAERLRQLNEEIRNYPQPIARCDAQLGGLVEERSKVQAALARLGLGEG